MTTEMTKSRWNKWGTVLFAAGLSLCWATTVRATDDALLQKLVDKGILNQQEADQLKQEMAKDSQSDYDKFNKLKVASWIDKMNLYGDFRLRMDDISQESALGKPDRLRWRYRLRVGTDIAVQDWANLGFRLISNDTTPGNPNSGNSTFTGSFSKKPVDIDLAYVKIHPPQLDWLQVIGGKMDPPTWAPALNSPMIYDPDLTVEGLGEQLNFKFGDQKQFRVFANGGQYAVHEFSGDQNDVYMFDMQGGMQANLSPVTITAAGGYYLTHNLDANAGTGGTALGDGSNHGNSTKTSIVKGTGGTNTVYLADFAVLYGMAEMDWNVCKHPILGTPAVVKLMGVYMKNVDNAYVNDPAGDATTGWTVQGQFGDAQKKGQWQVAYQYKSLEANATWDSITDDDFGNGGTDRKGHVIKAVYNVKDWWQLGFTAFVTEKISSLTDRPNSGHNQVGFPGQDHLHVEADTLFKF